MAKPSKKPAAPSKSPTKRADAAPSKRADGWENVLTGLGTYARDKRRRASMVDAPLTREEAEGMWVGDFLVARVIEAPVEDMLRGGFSVNVSAVEGEDDEGALVEDALPPPPGIAPPAPKHVPGELEVDDTNKRMGDLLDAKLEDLGAHEVFEQAMKDERALGGSAVLIGAVDGSTDLSKPLDEVTLKDVRFLTNFTAQDCTPAAYYGDPTEARYGQVMVYRLQPLTMPSSYAPGVKAPSVTKQVFVHESRLIVFPGIQTTRRERLKRNGWGQSVVERVHEAVRDYRVGMQGAGVLLADFAQAVLKVKGLAEIFQSNDEDALRSRFAGMDAARSLLRMLVIDADEEFERKPTPVSGYSEILDRLATQVSASCEIPVTRLYGQAPAGLNATGASDIRAYYDAIDSKRAMRLRPRLERLARLVMLSKEGPTNGIEPATWSIQFPPLWQPTAKERAEERKIVADTDVAYINAGVLTEEEVAASRFGGDEWSPETVLDLEGRAESARLAEKAEPVEMEVEEKPEGPETAEGDEPPGAT